MGKSDERDESLSAGDKVRFVPEEETQSSGDKMVAHVAMGGKEVIAERRAQVEEKDAGGTTVGPSGVQRKENIVFDKRNPNIARAIPGADYITRAKQEEDEQGRNLSGTYPAIIEGSDSERTGNS